MVKIRLKVGGLAVSNGLTGADTGTDTRLGAEIDSVETGGPEKTQNPRKRRRLVIDDNDDELDGAKMVVEASPTTEKTSAGIDMGMGMDAYAGIVDRSAEAIELKEKKKEKVELRTINSSVSMSSLAALNSNDTIIVHTHAKEKNEKEEGTRRAQPIVSIAIPAPQSITNSSAPKTPSIPSSAFKIKTKPLNYSGIDANGGTDVLIGAPTSAAIDFFGNLRNHYLFLDSACSDVNMS